MANTTVNIYPPVGFHFRVTFQGVPGIRDEDMFFQDVSGLTSELETETVKSGGENRFSFKLPTRGNYPNLVLKRGLMVNSALIGWMRNAIENLDIVPVNILVTILNEDHQPLQTYSCSKAYPLKWSVSDLNALESRIVVESLEMYYQYFKIV